jgi:hypothetical protein
MKLHKALATSALVISFSVSASVEVASFLQALGAMNPPIAKQGRQIVDGLSKKCGYEPTVPHLRSLLESPHLPPPAPFVETGAMSLKPFIDSAPCGPRQ